MLTEFEDQYIDVLQNIEWALLSLVKDHPELSDHDMPLRIIEQALTYYKSRAGGRPAPRRDPGADPGGPGEPPGAEEGRLPTRDARVKERKKYGLKKARKAPQYSKR